jgi:hypothetical protein
VDATVPAEFVVSGVPITTAGTIAITKANEAANTVWAGPTAGAAAQPTFRSLVTGDMPLTAKGQLLTFGVAPALLASGSPTTILTMDPAVALGMKWAAPAVQQSSMLDGGTVHTDTAVASPVKGSLMIGNATPKWDRLAVGTNYKILEADSAAANGILWASRGWSTVWGGFTPTVLGPDTDERMVPYHPSDGTRSITWNVRRIWFRVAGAGGAPAVTIEMSTATGLFAATLVGTLTMGGGAFEVVVTAALGTLVSGTKIRFNVTALGTATGWAIGVELGS